MTLFLINMLVRRSEEKATRLQSIDFVTIKKEDERAEGEEEESEAD